MAGMQEAWLNFGPHARPAGLPRRDRLLVPRAEPPTGGEWYDNVMEVLVEAWSGGIPRDEVCERANEAANAALSA